MHPTRRWERILPAAPSETIAVADDAVYGAAMLSEPAVYGLSLSTGDLLWERRSEFSTHGGVAFHDGSVYYGDDSGRLYAVDAVTGDERWVGAAEGADRYLDPDARPELPDDSGLQWDAMFADGVSCGAPPSSTAGRYT